MSDPDDLLDDPDDLDALLRDILVPDDPIEDDDEPSMVPKSS